ncbi:hypothetical protein [Salinimonas chungwhensis]|uniref:hypothetical protein n=1 Tax=Salinimonas chungwhensis TaxID=265425 RepID=UPI000374C1A7|nr:hypothetical protein [Salinimonas chungwhensis]
MRKSKFNEEQIVKILNSKLKQLLGEKELDISALKAALRETTTESCGAPPSSGSYAEQNKSQ